MRIPFQLINVEAGLHWSTRCAIRVCLLLSLWNLPFPWLHHHDLVPSAQQSDWLPTHLNQYHAASRPLSSTEQGWHLHFFYLGEEQSQDPLHKRFPVQHWFIIGELSQSLPGFVSARPALLDQTHDTNALNPFAQPAQVTRAEVLPQADGGHFLQIAPGLSLGDLLSVSLC